MPRKNLSVQRNRSRLSRGMFVLGAAVAVGLTTLVISTASSAPSPLHTPAPAPSGRIAPYLIVGTPSDPTRQAFEIRRATYYTGAILTATAHPSYVANSSAIASLAPQPTPTVQVGVIEDRASPDRTSYVQNRWQGDLGNGQMITVFAGSLKSDPSQGVVLIYRGQVNGAFGIPTVVQTPARHGSVRIVGVAGTVFTLMAVDGTTYLFDRSQLAITVPGTPSTGVLNGTTGGPVSGGAAVTRSSPVPTDRSGMPSPGLAPENIPAPRR